MIPTRVTHEVDVNQETQNILASESLNVTIKIWDFDNFTCRTTLHGHTSSVNCLTLVRSRISMND